MPIIIALPLLPFLIEAGLFIGALVLPFILGPTLRDVLSNIPIVGGSLAAAVQGAVINAQGKLSEWAHQNVDPLVAVIFAPVNALADWVGAVGAFSGAVVQSLQLLAQSAGGAAGALAHRVGNLAAAIAAQALAMTGLQQLAQGLAAQLHTALVVTIPGMVTAGLASLSSAFHIALTAEAALSKAAVAAAIGQAQALFAAAQVAIQVGDAALAHQLTHLGVQLSAQIVAVQAGTVGYVDGLVKPLGLDLDQLRNVVIPATLAAAIAATTVVATRLDQLERDCINPTCTAITPSLQVLNALAQGLELALLLEIVAGAIRDPQGAAHDVSQHRSDLAAAMGPFVSFLGIRT
jgi:hypothetical protein